MIRQLCKSVAVLGLAAMLGTAQAGWIGDFFRGGIDVSGENIKIVRKDLIVTSSTLTASTIGTATITTGTVSSLNGADYVRSTSSLFFDPDVAASQTSAALGVDPSASVGGSVFKYVPMPSAGSIIGMQVLLSTTGTTGTITAAPTIDGTAISEGVTLTAHELTGGFTAVKDTYSFSAESKLGMKLTSSADWTVTTSDLVVNLIYEH